MLGAHLSRTTLESDITTSGAEVVQIFVSNPRGYQPPARQTIEALASVTVPVYVHLPYLVNPASADASVRSRSRSLIEATDKICENSVAGIVVHAGQAGKDASMTEAMDRWSETLDGLNLTVPLLIENTAGGSTAPGRKLTDLIELVVRLRTENHLVGVCYDTCHGFAAGYEDQTAAFRKLSSALGRVDLVHLNDSRDPLNSSRDRHALIDQGTIGIGELAAIASLAEAERTAVVLETPGDPQIWRGELERLRAMIR